MREEDLSYFDNGEFKKALHAYTKAQSEGVPVYMDPDDLTDIAEYFMIKGQEEEAAKVICIALRLHPDSTSPRVFLARQNMFTGNMDKAKAICEAIPDQDDREVAFLRGELILREKGEEAADKYLIREAEKVVDDQDVFYSDCAEIFIDYAKWETANRWIGRLHKKFPSYEKTDALAAEVLMGLEKYKQAIPLLVRLIDKNPFNANLWVMQGDAYVGVGDFSKALDCSENALAISDDNERALAIKGNCLLMEGNLNEANPIYERLIKMNPQSVMYHYFHAICLAQIQCYSEASEALDRSVRVNRDPSSVNMAYVYLHQVTVEIQNKNYEKALHAVDKLKDYPSVVDDVESHILRGHVLLAKGDIAEAVKMFDVAMRETKDMRDTFMRIGTCFLQVGNLGMAERLLRNILDASDEKEYIPCLPTLAYIYWAMEDIDNCLLMLSKCDARYEENLRALFSDEYPGVSPSEYYMYIYKQYHGDFPES